MCLSQPCRLPVSLHVSESTLRAAQYPCICQSQLCMLLSIPVCVRVNSAGCPISLYESESTLQAAEYPCMSQSQLFRLLSIPACVRVNFAGCPVSLYVSESTLQAAQYPCMCQSQKLISWRWRLTSCTRKSILFVVLYKKNLTTIYDLRNKRGKISSLHLNYLSLTLPLSIYLPLLLYLCVSRSLSLSLSPSL